MVVMRTEGPVYMVEVVFFCYFFCFCHSFCMPILASRLLGASLAFSSYRGAQIAAWVSPWSEPYTSTNIKKKKKKKNGLRSKSTTTMNLQRKRFIPPTTDLHVDAVWALATKRDPATQLDLCEQRSKTTLEATVANKRLPHSRDEILGKTTVASTNTNG